MTILTVNHMKPEVISKFANKILASEDSEAIYYSSLQFQYFSCEEDFVEYFSILSNSNLIYAVFIYLNFKQQFRFESAQVQSNIIAVISDLSYKLEGSALDLKPDFEASEEYGYTLLDINRIAELCIADLLICNRDEIHDAVFLKNIKRIKRNEDSYRAFLSRCSELLSLLDNYNRCSCTMILIAKLIEYFNNDENTVLLMIIRLLAIRPLYFYGEETSQMINCIVSLYRLNNPFILRQLLELFPQINFCMLATDLNSFLKLSEVSVSHRNYESNIIQLIKCAEVLSLRSDPAVTRPELERIVFEEYKSVFANNRSLKNTVDVYFLCKSIIENPEEIDLILSETISTNEIINKALDDVEQEAFLSLIRENPQKIMFYLQQLNTANAYKLNNIERDPDRNNIDFYKSQLRRLSAYYDENDLAYIFMNSHLRFSVQIEELFKLIYEKTDHKRDDYMIVARTFEKYRINGYVVRNQNKIVFKTNQFLCRHPELTVSGYSNITENDIKKIIYENNGRVLLTIRAFTVARKFNPQMGVILPDENRQINHSRKERIDAYINTLKHIAENKKYTPSDIAILSKMPADFRRYEDCKRIGFQILLCCIAFGDNVKTVEFLKSLRNYPFKMDDTFYVMPKGQDREEIKKACYKLANRVIYGNGSFEDKLFIYFNTLLRMTYFLEIFLFKMIKDRDCVDFCDIDESLRYTIAGNINAINGNEIELTSLSFINNFEWPTICYVSDDNHDFHVGDKVTFLIKRVDNKKKIYYAEKLARSVVLNSRFCDGMNKASITLDLNRRDKANLRIMPAGLEFKLKKKLARDELLAIKLRISNEEMLRSFLELIRQSNPWSYSESDIPCILLYKELDKYQVESTLNDLIDNYSVDFVTQIYFNTSLKSACSLDYYVYTLINKHIDMQTVLSSLSHYVINIFMKYDYSEFLANVNLDQRHFYENGVGRFSVSGYDKDQKLVKLSPLIY